MKAWIVNIMKAVVVTLLVFACHPSVPPKSLLPLPLNPVKWVLVQKGKASYYAEAHHGRRTASGSTFDMQDLTAAHKTLPFGSLVRVVNRWNGRSVVVRITDRGPFVEGRVIDLSQRAARVIGLTGIAPVLLQMEERHAHPTRHRTVS